MFSSLLVRLEAVPRRTLAIVHDWMATVMADAAAGDAFADDVREELLGGLEHFERLTEASTHPEDAQIRAYCLGATVGAFPAPLHEAAGGGCPRVAKLLLGLGTGVDSCVEDFVTPLYLAAKNGHVEVGRALLAAGADVNFRGPGQRTPLFAAISRKSRPFIDMLLAAGARVDGFARIHVQPHPGPCLITPVMFAVLEGETEVARGLLDAGADLTAATPSVGTTAVHFAAMCGNTRALRELLGRGAAATAPDRDGNTPLHYLMRGVLANTNVIVSVRAMVPLYIAVLRCLVGAGGAGGVAARNAAGLTPLGLLALGVPGSVEDGAAPPDWAPIAAELVAQGATEWGHVPRPCPGLGRALVPVWVAAPDQLGPLFQRLDPALQATTRTALLALHRRLGTAALVMQVLGVALEQAEDGLGAPVDG